MKCVCNYLNLTSKLVDQSTKVITSKYPSPTVEIKLTNQLHETGSFLRSHQSSNYSGISQNFMGPESSLQCSQESSTGPYL
jgi:hypothetical protein